LIKKIQVSLFFLINGKNKSAKRIFILSFLSQNGFLCNRLVRIFRIVFYKTVKISQN